MYGGISKGERIQPSGADLASNQYRATVRNSWPTSGIMSCRGDMANDASASSIWAARKGSCLIRRHRSRDGQWGSRGVAALSIQFRSLDGQPADHPEDCGLTRAADIIPDSRTELVARHLDAW